jgi:carboxyl-terminal processing protease
MKPACRYLLWAVLACVATASRADWPAGVWRSVGYGELVEVTEAGWRHFEISAAACIERPAQPRAALTQQLGAVTAARADALSVRRGISRYTWQRVPSLPVLCQRSSAASGARDLFEIVWTTFDEHYAFFAERGVDWPAARRDTLAALPTEANDDALFAALSRALAPLRDLHVRVRARERLFVSGRPPTAAADPDGLVARYAHLVPALKQFLQDGPLIKAFRTTANDQLWWGRIGADIAYIALPSLWDFSGRANTDQDHESAAADAAMDEVLAALRDVRGMVIDLRVNSGGSDAVGLAIAGRFADRARLAFTKQARHEGGLTPPYEVRVEPSVRERFDAAKPVVVLAGPLTASAAEVMVLGLRVLPNVTVLGGRTLGVFSDTLYRRLPNGWEFTVSNEVYRAPDGSLFEGVGIPPRVVSQAARPPQTRDERFGADIRAARELILRTRP